MVSLEVIATLLSGISISASLFYYANVLRNTSKSQQIQLLHRLHDSKSDVEGLETFFELMWLEWEDFDDWRDKYSAPVNPKKSSKMESQLSYLDGLGVLVKQKVIDLETLYDINGRRVIMYWLKFETVIDGLRSGIDLGDGIDFGPGPDYCEHFEYIATELIKIRKQKNLPLPAHYIHKTTKRYKDQIK